MTLRQSVIHQSWDDGDDRPRAQRPRERDDVCRVGALGANWLARPGKQQIGSRRRRRRAHAITNILIRASGQLVSKSADIGLHLGIAAARRERGSLGVPRVRSTASGRPVRFARPKIRRPPIVGIGQVEVPKLRALIKSGTPGDATFTTSCASEFLSHANRQPSHRRHKRFQKRFAADPRSVVSTNQPTASSYAPPWLNQLVCTLASLMAFCM